MDSSYWIAVANPKDQWSGAAAQAMRELATAQLVTTEEVPNEVLDYFSDDGPWLRRKVAQLVRDLLEAGDVTVLVQSHETFSEGLKLYERRADKAYSHTDCVSMHTMTREGIDEILSSDRHFSQEGFSVFMR